MSHSDCSKLNCKVKLDNIAIHEEIFRNIFDNSAIGSVIGDLEGNYLRVNQQFCNFLGYTEQELLTLRVQDVSHPNDFNRNMDGQNQLISGQLTSFQMEKRYIHKHGYIVWGLLANSLIKNEQGQPEYIISQVQDITERKNIERELKESEERYRLLFEHCPEPIAVHYKGEYLYVNQSAARLFGFSKPREMAGKKVDEFIHPTVSDKINTAVQEKKSLPLQFNKIITAAGEPRDVEIMAIPFEYKGKIAVQAVYRDITERDLMEKAIRESEEKFRLLFNNVNDAIVLTEVEGDNLFENLLQTNPVLWRKLGLTEEELIRRYPHQLIDDKDYIRLQPIAKELLTGNPVIYEVSLISKEGIKIPFECSSRLLRLGDKNVVLTTARDISDRKSSEAQLKTSYSRLKQANKELLQLSQYKTEFLANMSHEFRTPLTSVLALSSELLEKRVGPLNITQERYLKDISDSGDHLLRLINDLLDLSKIDSGKMELDLSETPVGVIVNYVREKLLPLARAKEIELKIDIEGQNVVICDPRKIRQAISNLVDNAIKFNPRKSFIEIRVFEVSIPKEGTVIEVNDKGPGISSQYKELIFDTFYQVSKGLNKLFRGSGLGLALAKKIVELHTGYIKVISKPGDGATFSVFLPTYPELEPDLD